MIHIVRTTIAKTAILGAIALAGFAVAPAGAASQGDKMKACAAEYKSKGIDKADHKAFMSMCLKKDNVAGQTPFKGGAPAVPAAGAGAMTQQSKMTDCNAKAKARNLAGADRKAFLSSCLKG